MAQTEAGTIKFFAHKHGYGIIVPSDGSADVFFHTNQCRFQSSLLANECEPVRFQREERPGPDGWRAAAVWLVNTPGVCPCCGAKMKAA